MPRGNKCNAKNDDEIAKLVQQGKTDGEIAEELGIPRTTVCSARKRLGLAPARRRGQRGPDRSQRAGRLSDVQRKKMLDILHQDPGASVPALARAAGLTCATSEERRAAYAVIRRFLQKLPDELARRREAALALQKLLREAAREAATRWVAEHGGYPKIPAIPTRTSVPVWMLDFWLDLDQDYTHFITFVYQATKVKLLEYIYNNYGAELTKEIPLPLNAAVEPEKVQRLFDFVTRFVSSVIEIENEESIVDHEITDSASALAVAGGRRRGRGGAKTSFARRAAVQDGLHPAFA